MQLNIQIISQDMGNLAMPFWKISEQPIFSLSICFNQLGEENIQIQYLCMYRVFVTVNATNATLGGGPSKMEHHFILVKYALHTEVQCTITKRGLERTLKIWDI